MPTKRSQGPQVIDVGMLFYLDDTLKKKEFDEVVTPTFLQRPRKSATLASREEKLSDATCNGAAHYKEYRAWVARQGDYKNSEVCKELSHHNTLQSYLCPLSLQFFMNPIQTPHGDVYDFESITHPAFIDRNGMIKDPLHNPAYCADELEELPELLIKMQAAIVRVLHSQVAGEQISAVVRKGLEAFIKGLGDDIRERRMLREKQLADQIPHAEEPNSFWKFLTFWK